MARPKPELLWVLIAFSYLTLCLHKSPKGRNLPMSGEGEVTHGRDGTSARKAMIIQLTPQDYFERAGISQAEVASFSS